MKLINIPDSTKFLTLREVLDGAYSDPQADLSGYIALTDSILYLIRYIKQETEEVSIMMALLMCMHAWSIIISLISSFVFILRMQLIC